jgi:hypothetical protein
MVIRQKRYVTLSCDYFTKITVTLYLLFICLHNFISDDDDHDDDVIIFPISIEKVVEDVKLSNGFPRFWIFILTRSVDKFAVNPLSKGDWN